jgi:hypothetical protein
MRNSKNKKGSVNNTPAADILLHDYNFNLKYRMVDADKR